MKPNQKMGRMAIAAVAAMMMIPDAGAKPAYLGTITYVQPDGTEIAVKLRGDHLAHAMYDIDGEMLAVNDEGFVVKAPADYVAARNEAMARASQRRVENANLHRSKMISAMTDAPAYAPASRDTYLFSGTPFPAEGDPHALVILVEFTDKHFSLKDPNLYFSRMLNEEGFSDWGMLGSAKDYFYQNSNGRFIPVFDVYGPIELSNKMKYYGENKWNGDDSHPEEIVIEACRSINSEVDFSQYDLDGDGYIDNVYIYYAGYGEADSGIVNTVWPHSANLSDFNLGKEYKFDGVILDRYGMSNEVDYQYRRTDGVSTFIHEFSHVLGLPDIYATEYTNAYTPGNWTVLDMGTYNNCGLTPPNYSFFERMSLNWAKPMELPVSGNYELPELTESNSAYIIHTEKADEFFILENRQQRGWDEFLPGHGMLAWHIDFNQKVWDDNVVNNSAFHQYVDIEEADNQFSDNDQDGDTFPGASHITEFSYYTRPALASWDNRSTGIALSNIAESEDGLITFYAECDASGVVEVALAEEIEIASGAIINRGESNAEVFDLAGIKIAEILPGESLAPEKGIYIVVNQKNRKKVSI